MIKEGLDKLFEKKGVCIALSILLSVILWAYVEYVENPDTTVSISNIPVTFVGDDVLGVSDLVVTSRGASALNIRFVGKRNVVTRLSNQNITATVDLAEIVRSGGKAAGIYQLPYILGFPDGVSENSVSVADASSDFISITVEKMITREIPVVASFDGDVAEGYQGETPQCSLSVIKISGPQAIVANVSRAEARMTGSNISRTFEQETGLLLLDLDGEEVDTEQLTLSEETATVTLPVLMVKDVALVVNLVPGVSATELNTKVTCEPEFVTLAGDPEILDDLNQITLGSVDLTSFAVTTTDSFMIAIPNGANNLTGKNSANVTVEVVGQSTKRLSVTNIQVKEATEGYKTNIITQSLDVLLRGPEQSLMTVTSENIRIIADLSSLGNTTGTYSVAAKVLIDGHADLDAIGTYKVTVGIAEGDPETAGT